MPCSDQIEPLSQKQRGAWYTPDSLIGPTIDWLATSLRRTSAGPLRVVDPACGDGRLLVAVRNALRIRDIEVELFGCDIDREAAEAASRVGVTATHANALDLDWDLGSYDIVIGNPPFLSQMATQTTRGGSSRHGGGPYADTAVEFLALAHRLVRPDGGRVALVLPQSILGARDAQPVRSAIDATAQLDWSWWERDQREFDANINVCVLGWRTPGANQRPWTAVVTHRLGLPDLDLDSMTIDGTVGDRNHLNANFRDEYYALVPAVSDAADGPPLITSGLIDPARCHWGTRPVRFAKQRFQAPRVDLSKLTGRFPAWAERKLVPKVLIANQTSVIEAVADPGGTMLPGVPVTTATPTTETVSRTVWETAAVLTSPVATAYAWHHGAGTGLSTKTVRIGPTSIAATPWPEESLDHAIELLRSGSPVPEIGAAVMAAYGVDDPDLLRWWSDLLPVERAS